MPHSRISRGVRVVDERQPLLRERSVKEGRLARMRELAEHHLEKVRDKYHSDNIYIDERETVGHQNGCTGDYGAGECCGVVVDTYMGNKVSSVRVYNAGQLLYQARVGKKKWWDCERERLQGYEFFPVGEADVVELLGSPIVWFIRDPDSYYLHNPQSQEDPNFPEIPNDVNPIREQMISLGGIDRSRDISLEEAVLYFARCYRAKDRIKKYKKMGKPGKRLLRRARERLDFIKTHPLDVDGSDDGGWTSSEE
ncbi:hypothetical protein QBC38DRAFT_451751 [Podospora fimiseda]|uniref:Uncharacterized protein n=1 Tax=Podospora fimiseda TaxID=252190 RepID=A0AAN7BX08_9PEZI|nr:hypothetical protein QBC38DRAFT_451751 [Podospora fimiseda]